MMNHLGTRTIETERLILRRFAPGDAQPMFDHWAHDAEVTRYLRWQPHENVELTEKILAGWLDAYADDRHYHWAITRKEDQELIGSIGVDLGIEADQCAEIGYCIGRAYWGHGYMPEAVIAIRDYLFYNVGLNRLEAFHAVANPASGAVMRKAGMRYEGCLRQRYRNAEGFMDCDQYAVVKSDLYQPAPFTGFYDLGDLTDGELSLVCTERKEAQPERGRVPAYHVEMRVNGQHAGQVSLRVGMNDALYFSGHIGYNVEEAYRGHDYTVRACRLLAPLLRQHGLTEVLITNDPANAASRRVCEKLGAKLVRIAELPEDHEMYADGARQECIWAWHIKEGE